MTTYDATGNVHLPTFEEIRHLYLADTKDGDPSPLQTDIVSVALNAGMRRGEILKLKWDDVDLRNVLFMARDTKNGASRAVPINGAVREVLAGVVRRLDSQYVFCNPKGQPLKEIRHAFSSACRKAGIKDFRFHDLRHTAASFMAMGGVSLLAIGTILGHKTPSMTKRYSHLSPEHLQGAVAVIDRAMNQTGDQLTQFSGTVAICSPLEGTTSSGTA